MLKMDGFDDCIAGVVSRFGQDPILCYDRAKVIAKLAADTSEDEAVEFHEYNQAGAWMGWETPCFLDPYDP